MKQKKAFISGPIQGMETQQEYRKTIAEICNRCGYETIDPWRREKILYNGTEHGWWNRVPEADFIRRDLEDIEKSDILIAYFPMLSAGTCMELFYAKLKGKTTLSICQMENPSQWILFHSDIVLKTMEELEKTLVRLSSQ
jgi:nucleoside 2-deoxyribosyltransferase